MLRRVLFLKALWVVCLFIRERGAAAYRRAAIRYAVLIYSVRPHGSYENSTFSSILLRYCAVFTPLQLHYHLCVNLS